jgi:hypothetical protein
MYSGQYDLGSILTVARHIFQACPVWIYTQSNITSIILLRIFLQMKNPKKLSLLITKLSISQTYMLGMLYVGMLYVGMLYIQTK